MKEYFSIDTGQILKAIKGEKKDKSIHVQEKSLQLNDDPRAPRQIEEKK